MPNRKSAWSTLNPENPGPIQHGVAHVRDRGRMQIPPHLVKGVAWLTSRQEPAEALAVFRDAGRISLHSWLKESPPILQRRDELIADAADNPEALHALEAVDDKYHRLVIPKDLRFTLTDEVVLHLGLSLEKDDTVYVVRIGDIVEIRSVPFRNQYRSRKYDLISDLL